MFKFTLLKDRYIYISICIIAFAIYANSLGNDWVSDDREGILFNPAVGDWNYVFRSFIGMGNAITRLIIFHVFGLQAWAFRLFNIIMHAGVGCSIYYLFRNLYDRKLGLLTAFLFIVHPILSESITWIAGAGYVSYALYFLVSFIFFLESEDKYNWKYFVSLIFYAAAILTSEKAISLAAIFILYKFIYSEESKATFLKSASYLLISIPFVYLLTQIVGKRSELLAADYYQESGFINPLHQIPIAITEYLQLFLWPQALTLYHSETVYSYLEYFIRLGFFLLILIPIIIMMAKLRGGYKNIFQFWKTIEVEDKSKYSRILDYKFITFWFFFFIIALLPTLTPLKISWLVAERYAYLGMLGVIAIASYLFYKLSASENFKIAIIGIFIFILSALGIRTVYRNMDWYNEDTLWFATVKYSPSSPNIHNNLGDVYSRREQYDLAIKEFTLATQLKPNYADAYHNLAYTYQTLFQKEQDQAKREEYFNATVNYYREAIKYNPNLWQSHQNLGILFFQQGEIDKGYEEYRQALTINPYNPNLIAIYININVQLQNYDEAEKTAEYLLSLDPTNSQYQDLLTGVKEIKANPPQVEAEEN